MSSCAMLKTPPVRSSSICPIAQPSVDLALKLLNACGTYLTHVTISFTYEAAYICGYVRPAVEVDVARSAHNVYCRP